MLLVLTFGIARTAVHVTHDRGRNFEVKRHNVNQIEMSVSNFGQFGHDDITDDCGLWWPKGTQDVYVFGAGSWFGTLQEGDTLVTIGYGPSGGESEYTPGLQDMSFSDENAIIFIQPTPWPPPLDVFPMAPDRARSHQDSWCAYNDLNETYHMPGDTRPIGLEVYQTVYAWNLSSTQDMIFIKYDLVNVSGVTLDDCYFGVITDNDIGNEGGEAGNDICSAIIDRTYIIGSDTFHVDNVAYQWQTEEEPGFSRFPGVLGFDYLQSPYDLVPGQDKDGDGILDQYERDSAWYVNNLPEEQWDVDLDGTPDWRDPSEIPQFGLTSYRRFTRGLEPGQDWERYLTMAGYDFRTLVYDPYDTIIPEPADQRFGECSGPFTLEPADTVTVLVGVILAEWHGMFETPDSALASVDFTAQFIYDQNWLLPGPPSTPLLTCIPGDAQVTLIWDSKPENEPDQYYYVVSDPDKPALYDPFYLEYDFEGYRIWRSLTGRPGDWEVLESADKYNDVTFIEISDDETDTLIAENTGLVHSYVDDGVRNGFTYYYAVTAFDWNRVKETDTTWSPIIFESGKVGITAAPRRNPANYVPGSCSIAVVSGNPLLVNNISYNITYPMAMNNDIINAQFGPITWGNVYVYDTLGNIEDSVVGARYKGFILDHNNVKFDSTEVVVPVKLGAADIPHAFMTLNGVSVMERFVMDSLETGAALFDSIEVRTGDYPPDLPTPAAAVAFPNINLWAYRGNDYEIHWISTTGGTTANSAIVIDAITGDTIPYSIYHPYQAVYATDTLANGWGFWANRAVSDTIVLNGPSPQALWNTKWLYICGGLIAIKGGGQLMPGDQLPEAGDIWYAHATDTYVPAPANAAFIVQPSPAFYDDSTQIAELNVKVVPNPYVIHNEWQQSLRARRLKFINLPANCVIRIFNLNGELVRTIHHTSTLEPDIGAQEVFGSAGGDEWWDLLSANNQLVASGVYIFHIDSDVGEQIGKFVVIR